MGLLSSVVGWLLAFGAGFLGHVVAHDFCEVTPMISRKIIEAAASRLPASIRERYREEWRADLQAQSGALAKLAWSLGCLRSTRRLRREAAIELYQRTTFDFVLNDGEVVTLDFPTTAVFRSALKLTRRKWLRHAPAKLNTLAIIVALVTPAVRWRRCGKLDLDVMVKLLHCCADQRRIPRHVIRCVDGVAEKTTDFNARRF
jgi:hypothetical protein